MKNQSGKTPLGWIITIVISLLVAGVVIAMIFADNENVSEWIKQTQNQNQIQSQNTSNNVKTQEK